jgi:hypothetical protein
VCKGNKKINLRRKGNVYLPEAVSENFFLTSAQRNEDVTTGRELRSSYLKL